MATTLNSSGVLFPDSTTQTSAIGLNRIINGGMTIDQRNLGVIKIPNSGDYCLDRYFYSCTALSKASVQQQSLAPNGFTNSLRVNTLSAHTVGVNDTFAICQPIEGTNIIDLAWGTASAATVTLSFRVYSSLTGTFGGAILNSAQNRSYPFSYSISSANTWTTISITITGDTSGTWLNTNAIGMYVFFGLGVGSNFSGTAGAWVGSGKFSTTGSVSLVGTNGANWYITGIQLEKGNSASPFSFRHFSQELALCQRYFLRKNTVATSVSQFFTVDFPQMRTSPTIGLIDSEGGTGTSWTNGATAGLNYYNPSYIYALTANDTPAVISIPLDAEL